MFSNVDLFLDASWFWVEWILDDGHIVAQLLAVIAKVEDNCIQCRILVVLICIVYLQWAWIIDVDTLIFLLLLDDIKYSLLEDGSNPNLTSCTITVKDVSQWRFVTWC